MPASEYSDAYGKGARTELDARIARLPEPTRWVTRQMLTQLDGLSEQIRQFEQRLDDLRFAAKFSQYIRLPPIQGCVEG